MSKLFVLFAVLPLVFGACPGSVIMASSDTSLIEVSPGVYANPVKLIPHPLWAVIDGASWVWIDTICAPAAANNYEWQNAECLNRNLKFISNFTLPEWKRNKIESLALYAAVDTNYEIVFNGNVISPMPSGIFNFIKKFELKDLFLGSTGRRGIQENILEVTAANPDGPNGVVFKVEMTYK